MQTEEVDKITAELRKQGFRITGQRKAILNLMLESKGLPSADEIRKQLSAKKITADKATVYRNIQFLKEMGLIDSVKIEDDVQRFEVSSKGHHHHFICQNCKRVEHFELGKFEDELIKKENSFARKFKINVSGHTLNFYGKCTDCA